MLLAVRNDQEPEAASQAPSGSELTASRCSEFSKQPVVPVSRQQHIGTDPDERTPRLPSPMLASSGVL